MKSSSLIAALLALSGLFFITSCKDKPQEIPPDLNLVSQYDYQVVYDWNKLYLEIERYAAGYRPCATARSLGYLGFAAYESCVSGMPEYQSLAPYYNGLTIPPVLEGVKYHWPTVVNASYAFLLSKFFKNEAADRFDQIATLENANNAAYKSEISAETFQLSQNYGRAVAAAIWEWSRTDDIAHDAYLDPFGNYQWQNHFDGNGDWKPTFPGPGKGLYPYWGQARTFALSESDKLCRPPLPFSQNPQSAMYAQALEVYAQNTPSFSYENEWVAEFWSDDLLHLTFSPPARWIAVTNQVLENEQANLEKALAATAKVGMALNDAGVGAWFSKYHYNTERPETYIRRVIDPNWKTNLNNPLNGDQGITPSFPSFPSGHATFSAAATEALTSEFGFAYAMTDRCHEGRIEFLSTPRTFSSFYEMAAEDAWSRILLGVHFRMDSEEGARFGADIGRRINDLPWKK